MQFLPQLLGQRLVLLLGGDRARERAQPQPAPYPVVVTLHDWPVVAGNDQLVGWAELEEILPHEPGADAVTAAKFLDQRFRQPAAALGFHARHPPLAAPVG